MSRNASPKTPRGWRSSVSVAGQCRRQLRRLFAVVLAVAAGHAMALGLGEIELDSALNERFDAEIEVLDASGLDSSEILVSLGSAEDFRRVGVERFFYLTDLRFEVERRGSKAVIKVSSGQPITEPYLNFLVEVLWPSGRMLKEYTVLLDPPTFVAAAPSAVTAPQRQQSSDASVGRSASAGSQTRPGTRVAVPARTSSAPRTGSVSGDAYGPTDRDDTLWKIAERTRPSGDISVAQYMLALQRANPGAFINDNINYLKAGYTLDLPSESAARSLTNSEALAEVRAQSDEWRALREGRSVPARDRAGDAPTAVADGGDLRSPVDARPEQDTPVGEERADGVQLRIVAGDGDGGADQPVGAEEGDTSVAGIDAIRDQNDELSREVEALAYQFDQQKQQYEASLAQQEQKIEIRDQKIAELERQLAERNAQAAQQQAENPSTSNPSDTPWWQTTPVLLGAGGVVVLGLIGLMVARRRSTADDEAYDFDSDVAVQDESSFARTEPELDGGNAAAAAPLIDDEGDDLEDDFSDLGGEVNAIDDGDVLELNDEPEAASPDTSTPTSQTSDVLGEAEIYIAYGRYPQAVGLLLGVLEEDPERHDVRAKLLELYVETNDIEGFEEHRDALVERCDDDELLDHVRALEARLAGEGVELAPSDVDDQPASGSAVAGLAAAGAAGAVDSMLDDAQAGSDSFGDDPDKGLDGTLDDFDLELDLDDDGLDLDSAVDTTELDATDDDVSFDLEFDDEQLDANLDGDLGTEVASSAAGRADDLGGDLGIDFNPDTDDDDLADLDADIDSDSDLDAVLESLGDASQGDAPGLDEDAFGDELDALANAGTGEAPEDIQEDLDAGPDGDAIDDDLDKAFAAAESDDSTGDSDFDFADGSDGADTKLDLARAYIDMADEDGARDILSEVLEEGNDVQRQTAQDLLDKL